MAALTPVISSRAGVQVAFSAGNAGGHTFTNADDRTVFLANNAGGSPVVYTISWGTSAAIDGSTPAAKTVSVPAGQIVAIGQPRRVKPSAR